MIQNCGKWLALVSAALLATINAIAADITWIGGTGNWDAAANWNPAQVPGPADNVFITGTGTYTVTIDKPDVDPTVIGSLTLGGASGTQILSVGNVVLTLNGASVVNANGHLDLMLNSSELLGPGEVTVNGTLNWAGGTIGGPGATTIGSGGVMAISGGVTLLTRTLNIEGIANWSAGNLDIDTGSVINNLAGGTFNIGFDGSANAGGAGGGVFNSAGLLQKTDGVLTANVGLQFNNTGSVDVRSGTLSLDDGGTHTGTFSSVSGAVTEFGGGNHVLTAASLVTGVLSLSGGGTLNASGTFDAGTTLNVISGTATLAASCNVTATTVNISGTGGTVVYNSSGTVETLNVNAGTLGGASPVTVTGLLTLAGGTVTNGLVTANGGLAINGNTTLSRGKLVNPGLAIWSAGSFTGENGAVFSNLLGATFINTFDGNAPWGAGAAPIFVNAGLFQKTNGTLALGTTSMDYQFINTGTVEVRTNTLRYAFNQQTAGLTLLDGGGLAAQAQPLQFLGGTLMGTGLVTMANTQSLTNSATINPGLPLGQLDIAGNYRQTVSGVLNIELGGYAAGTNFDRVTVAAGGGGGVATLGGTLNVTLTNGFSPTNGATFTLLTAVSRAGAFATFNYPSNDIGMQVSYDPTSAKVTVSNLKPVVANPIVDPDAGIYGTAFNFQFPANTFADPDGDPLTYTASGLPSGITFVPATRTFSGMPTEAGDFLVTVAATDNGIPNLTATNAFTITVSPAPLTITATAQSKTYGSTLTLNGATDFTSIGLQNGESIGSVTLSASGTPVGTAATAPVGSYAIKPSAATGGTFTAANYAITYATGTLTVDPAALTITATAQSKTYGSSLVLGTTAFTTSGLQNGETVGSVTLTASGTPAGTAATAPVGSYTITPSAATGGTFTAANYAITYATGALTVDPAALTITATARSKTYGSTLVLGATAFTTSGLQNGETVGSVTLTASGTPAGTAATAPVGSYTITPSAATGGTFTAANYAITYATGTLTVDPAGLTVTATAQSKTYGSTLALGTSAFTTSGLQNGETVGSVALDASGTPVGTAATAPVGSYTITPSAATGGTFTAANYAITYATGTLTVDPAALTITATAQSKSYGATLALGTSAFTTSGLQNGETVGSVTLSASGTPAGTAATAPVGSYTITPSAATGGTFAAANYAITYASGALTVDPAALTVTADAKTKTYGTADPVFTVTYAGFVNGETTNVLGGTLVIARDPGEAVGSYPITPNGLTSTNYAIAFNPGMLTITAPAPVLLPLIVAGSTNVAITWIAVSNGTYRVQYKSDLSVTNWTDLDGDVRANGSSASKTDTAIGISRFYRVVVAP